MRRLIQILAAMLLLAWSGLAPAQESSIQVLGPPEGESSGESPAEPPPPPPRCGTQPITIARMQWPSATLLAEIHARLLEANLDCTVRVQDSDMAAAGSSMGATGQPAVAPELWVARIAEIWNSAMKGQKVRQAGTTYGEAEFEGWFVPDYTAANWPDVTSVDGLKARAAQFGEGGAKGRFLSCPVDWGCAVVNRNLLRGYGLDTLFDIVEPANRFEMDTLIAEAVGRKQPLLFYYWQPNAILAQFGFKPVKLAAYDREAFLCAGRNNCPMPAPTGFAPDPVMIAVAEWVYLEAPEVAIYFQRARMPFAVMDQLLQQLGEPGATPASVADRFVAERGEVWRPWLGLAAAQ